MNKTILLIEDDDEVLRVYKAVLAEFGTLRVARNMDEARPQLAGVDLFILDFHLREEATSFQDIVGELKPLAPVLVCSGVPDPRILALGKQLGIAGYWNKGAGFDALRTKVKAALGA